MAIRTSAGAVIKLLAPGKDYDNQSDLAPFIETASSLVDQVDEFAVATGLTVVAARLELMERWLAAHCYKQSDQQHMESTTGKGKSKFTGKTGAGLDSTSYGRTALAIDPTGQLLAISVTAEGRNVVSAAWLGEEDVSA